MIQASFSRGLEAYNARWLSASEVAATFVAPPQFERLANHGHTILVGPRGSGKTTLLKMLQQPAIERWASPDADQFRDRIGYTGVFIPADVSWGEQLAALGSNALDDAAKELLSLSAFSTHILHALIEAMTFRIAPVPDDIVAPFRRATLSQDAENALVAIIADALKLRPRIPTLLSVKHALTGRMGDIYSIARAAQLHRTSNSSFPQEQFLFLDPLAAANACVEAFDDLVGESDGKWALLFDELEIAPDSIQQRLIAATRSSYPKFLYKLALSPYNVHGISTGGSSAPSADNDFDQLQLWYAHRDQRGFSLDKKNFCQALWRSMVSHCDMPAVSPEIALPGPSVEDAELATRPLKTKRRVSSPYAADGKWGIRFVSLYQGDTTFKQFLDERGVSPFELDKSSTSVRDSLIRKIAPIVGVREFFRRPSFGETNGGLGRSRKGIDIYTGAEALFEISEGHPRWFKVTIGRLLVNSRRTGKLEVEQTAQGQEVLAWAQRFCALLKTYPAGSARGPGKGSLLSLVDTIGRYFHGQVVKAPFTPEPFLSFTVDSNVDGELLTSLQNALNLGAIVYVPDNAGQVLLTSLRGKRFRLSYWLAPQYGLPLLLGRAVALSTILNTKVQSSNWELPLGDGQER